MILEQEEKLTGQMAFFPEMENDDPAPRIHLQHPIPVPDISQLPYTSVRILIADVLQRFDGILPEQWLFDIMVSNGYLNNFVYSDALGGLVEAQAVELCRKQDETYVVLTENGKDKVKKLRLMVPKVFRDRVHLAAIRHVSRQRALRDLRIQYEKDENGWNVALQCFDRAKEMFFLRINAPTEAEAVKIGEGVLRNPSRFFGKILELTLTNAEEPFDLTNN